MSDPSSRDEKILVNEEIFEEVVVRGMLRAREKVRIATANLKNFGLDRGEGRGRIVSELRALTREGVRVEILHGAVPSEPFLQGIKSGPPFAPGRFEMRFCPRVHMKLVLVDYARVFMGSANLTGAGMGARVPERRNFEMGIWTAREDLLDAAMALFDRVWSGEACDTCRRRESCPVPLEGISF